MPRPGIGPVAAAQAAGDTDRARGSPEAGADRQPGADPDRAPGAGPDHGDREQLPADALVDLDEEGKALQIAGLLERLDAEFVGLSPVKERVREVAALLLVDRLRARYALSSSRPSLHMCFTGSPGTGKTTMAMHMGELLHELGYLRQGQLVTATRDDLVGQYVGHTAPKTKDVLKRAMGGVLLIDEAYYLYRPDNERDYGQEAIEILLQFMEAHRDDLVVILAGYKERMDVFFRSNPGMASRIGHHIDFPDFGIGDLMLIAERMLDREEYRLSPEAAVAFREYVGLRMRQPRFAGARSIRNVIDRLRLRQAGRLVAAGGQVSRADLVEITEADVRGSRVFSDGTQPAPPTPAAQPAPPTPAAQPAQLRQRLPARPAGRLTGSDGLTGRGERQDQPDRGAAAG
jgi:probable Rubsico expression protein CbbX